MTTEPTIPTHQRDAALQAGRVAYRAEHGRWPSRSWKLGAPAPAPAPTPAPLQPTEREAWTAAYASEQGLGPLSSKWELQGGKLTMVWLLAKHTGPQRPTPPRN